MHNQTFEFATTFFQIKKSHTHPSFVPQKTAVFIPDHLPDPIWIRVFAAKVSRISLWKSTYWNPFSHKKFLRHPISQETLHENEPKAIQWFHSVCFRKVHVGFWRRSSRWGSTSFPLLFPIRTLGFPVNPLSPKTPPLPSGSLLSNNLCNNLTWKLKILSLLGSEGFR